MLVTLRSGMLLLGVLSTGVIASDSFDKLLAQDPSVEAAKAFKAGDRRYIVVPVCGDQPGEVLPGWPRGAVYDKPGAPALAFEKAMNQGQRPLTCADFDDDKKRTKFMKAVKYAERYNEKLRILELEK